MLIHETTNTMQTNCLIMQVHLCSFNLIVTHVRVFVINHCDVAYVHSQSHQLLIFHRLETSINIFSGHGEQVRIQYATSPKHNNLNL